MILSRLFCTSYVGQRTPFCFQIRLEPRGRGETLCPCPEEPAGKFAGLKEHAHNIFVKKQDLVFVYYIN